MDFLQRKFSTKQQLPPIIYLLYMKIAEYQYLIIQKHKLFNI